MESKRKKFSYIPLTFELYAILHISQLTDHRMDAQLWILCGVPARHRHLASDLAPLQPPVELGSHMVLIFPFTVLVNLIAYTTDKDIAICPCIFLAADSPCVLLTSNPLGDVKSAPSTQCAAVTTKSGAMMVPPQKWKLMPRIFSWKLTCHSDMHI